MAIAGQATTAYTYRVVLTDDERTIIEQRRTTALSSQCDSLDDALAALDSGKPTMVAGGDAAAVNEALRQAGRHMVARA